MRVYLTRPRIAGNASFTRYKSSQMVLTSFREGSYKLLRIGFPVVPFQAFQLGLCREKKAQVKIVVEDFFDYMSKQR